MSRKHRLIYELSKRSYDTLQDICEDAGEESEWVVREALKSYEQFQQAFVHRRSIQVEMNGVRKSIAPDDFVIDSFGFTLLTDSTNPSAFSEEMRRKSRFGSRLECNFPTKSYERMRAMAEKDGSNSSGIIITKALSLYRYVLAVYDDGGKLLVENEDGVLENAFSDDPQTA